MTEEILDRLPDGVVVVGADRTIVRLNRIAERITGWTRAEAVGRPYHEVLRLRDAGGFLVHEHDDPFDNAVRLSMGSPEREYMLHRRDGTDRWVALRTAYEWGAGGALESLVATMRDIGRRRRLERSAYDLIATLAHDLRSPLTSVKGFSSTLLRNWARLSDQQKQNMLATIEWDADRMNRLLTDLLDLSRLEAGRLELHCEEVDLSELASRLVERIQKDAAKHTLAIEFPTPFPPVMADRVKVEQVLANLVYNAVKHGDPGPVVVAGAVEDSQVVVRVTDSGPGIEAAHIPYLFTKFYRKGTGDRSSGTGLGLYIAKGIIEAHGGTIRVEKSSPSGSVFAFTLPLG